MQVQWNLDVQYIYIYSHIDTYTKPNGQCGPVVTPMVPQMRTDKVKATEDKGFTTKWYSADNEHI